MVRRGGRPVSGETGIEFLKERYWKINSCLKQVGQVVTLENTLDEEINFALSQVDLKK